MKKLLCCILILSTLCVALASCGGAGGDTNMHNVMKAIAKDNTLTSDDSYKYQTADKRPETPTESYKYVSAVSDGTGYYKHYIHFAASSTVIEKDTSETQTQIRFKWLAEENVIEVEVTSFSYSPWNAAKSRWEQGFGNMNGEFTFPMDVYYQNGKFTKADATYTMDELPAGTKQELSQSDIDEDTAKEIYVNAVITLLNDAMNGLNEVYTAKGFPIK